MGVDLTIIFSWLGWLGWLGWIGRFGRIANFGLAAALIAATVTLAPDSRALSEKEILPFNVFLPGDSSKTAEIYRSGNCTLTSRNSLQYPGNQNRRYLALDKALHDSLAHMEYRLGQARGAEEILKLNDEWEQENRIRHNLAGNVTIDHEYFYRLYYPVHVVEEEPDQLRGIATAVAYSADGTSWNKPNLGIADHLVDHPASNLIDVQPFDLLPDSPWPRIVYLFYDHSEPDQDKRYKGLWFSGNMIWTVVSDDGLHLNTHGQAIEHRMEANPSVFFDPHLEEYVIYGRIRGDESWVDHQGEPGMDPARRGSARHRSPQWTDIPWKVVGETVIDPAEVWDYEKDLRPDIYAPNIFYYHGQYIGFPAVYFRDAERVPPDRPEMWTGTGPIYPMIIYSRDGLNFTFPKLEEQHSIVDLEPHQRVNPRDDATSKEPEVGQIYTSSTPIELDDKLVIHYGVREDTHYEQFEGQFHGLFQAFLRLDGFAGLRAAEGETGFWQTPPIKVPEGAEHLLVNARVEGSLQVELIHPDTGEPILGFSRGDAVPFRGDEVRAVAEWTENQIEALNLDQVVLRFYVEEGEIFSFLWCS